MTLGNELEYAAAGTYQLAVRTSALVEVAGATAAKSPFGDSKQSPLEAVAGLRHRVGKLWLTVAGGPGFRQRIRLADLPRGGRRDLGQSAARQRRGRDRRRGRPLSRRSRRTSDGFEDGDGCPDPDNDRDGIPDVSDKCPDEPEDKDGFEDGDGCPDLDNDKDGIPDVTDKCPDKPETKNGFEDDDGCPDELPPRVRPRRRRHPRR